MVFTKSTNIGRCHRQDIVVTIQHDLHLKSCPRCDLERMMIFAGHWYHEITLYAQIHESWDATASRITIRLSTCSGIIESMQLSMHRNPLALFTFINFAVSSILGAQVLIPKQFHHILQRIFESLYHGALGKSHISIHNIKPDYHRKVCEISQPPYSVTKKAYCIWFLSKLVSSRASTTHTMSIKRPNDILNYHPKLLQNIGPQCTS